MKSKSSDMIRVLNELIPSVKKLNDLYRSGFSQQVEQGLTILIGAIERGETIGDSPVLQKLEAIEQRLSKDGISTDTVSTCKKLDVQEMHVNQGGVVSVPKLLPAPEPQILTEVELLDRFNLSPSWRSFVPHGWVKEFWFAQKTGAEYLGNDLYQLQSSQSRV